MLHSVFKALLQYLRLIQKLIIPRQKQINTGLLIFELFLLVIWCLAVFVALNYPQQVFVVLKISGKLGTASLLLFSLTLLPGIIMRLKVIPKITLPIATLITPFRRHLGILMFITAFVHMSFSSTLPYLALQLISTGKVVLPPPFRLFEQIGLIGWMLLLPVWLTSNDFSMKKLGKWWKRLQRLTYLALWLIFAHVAMQSQPVAVLLLVVGLLEMYSWVLVWRRKQK
ncbi:MAG TPA: ferric reductase-like transmembrane domain-containing protein [Candidatus Woesebacteria bacterium]|nr:ferric reductase-like transmembrane domain-containing protein [Candidatus Woesebacteria bacterium]